MCTFGNFFAPVLVAAHTANNLDLDHELKSLENEGYESDYKKFFSEFFLSVVQTQIFFDQKEIKR